MSEEAIIMSLQQMALGSTGCAVEQSESQGLRSAVAQEKLPTDIDDRTEWEALGFVFGAPCSDDPIFMSATLPAGWSKKASTDDHRTSNILDAAGNVRGSYFYKAAFYDRNANMGRPNRRYSVRTDYARRKASDYMREATMVVDTSTGVAIFSSQELDLLQGDYDGNEIVRQRVREESLAWLAEHFPQSTSGGIGLCGVLFTVFLVLKLAEIGVVSAWSWWWVCSPLWIPFAAVFGVLFGFLILKFIVMGVISPIVDWSNTRSKLKEFD